MKRIAFVVLALAFVAVARADGAQVFAAKCSMCHGKDGKGSPVGLKMGAQDLTQVKLTDAQIEQVVANGKGKMPAFKGKLSDADIAAVSKHVKMLK